MLVARDYTNNEYPLLATKVHTSELNGQDDLELKIPQQKNNNLDLLSIDKLWEFDYNNITYKAVNVKRQTRGNSFNLNVRAMPLFYWEFSKSIIHENHDGSHTANSAFRTVFDGSGFNFVLVDFSPAVTIEGFGKGANRLELFKRILDRYNYEFIIQGRTVYMHHRIGNDTNFMYKYKLNASNVSSTTDATEYFTHIKGFGNFEEGEEDYFNNAKLKREYTHPLADVVGKWEGSPIVDGRITQTSTLDEAMAQAVEDSLAVTIEGTLHDVRKIYDIAVPVKGDRVWLHDERINLEQEIRLHKIVTTYDEKDNIIACDVTFGSQSIGERHKANINSLSKRFTDLLTGKVQLPFDVLDSMSKDLLLKIQSVDSELLLDNGIFAIDKSNPNNILGLNSAGIYISTDGGATARTVITAEGVVAESIAAGSLIGLNITSIGQEGYFHVNGSDAEFRNTKNGRTVSISPDGIYGWNALGDTRFQADSLLVTSAALGTSNYNVYLAPMDGGEARVVRYSDVPGDGLVGSYNYQPIRAEGFYGNYWNINAASNGLHLYARPFSGGELRVTLNETTSNYQDVRADKLYANRLIPNSLQSKQNHFYLGTLDGGELRVVNNESSDNYRPVRAKEFITDTSDRKNKKNIEVFKESTLDTFRNMDVYLYNRSTDKMDARKQLGAMIDELPEVTHSAAGDSFALYAYTSYLAKGIKDLIEVVDNQEKRIKQLEG